MKNNKHVIIVAPKLFLQPATEFDYNNESRRDNFNLRVSCFFGGLTAFADFTYWLIGLCSSRTIATTNVSLCFIHLSNARRCHVTVCRSSTPVRS